MANTISLSQILKARPAVCPTIYGYILPDVPNHNGYIKIGYTDKEDVEVKVTLAADDKVSTNLTN